MLKVLIAEDDLMIADAADEALLESGYEVCGIARTVETLDRAAHSHAALAVAVVVGNWTVQTVYWSESSDTVPRVCSRAPRWRS